MCIPTDLRVDDAEVLEGLVPPAGLLLFSGDL